MHLLVVHHNVTSLNSGVFPTRIKYSIITPLYKKGDKNNVSNYRPISLLHHFLKYLKKLYITE